MEQDLKKSDFTFSYKGGGFYNVTFQGKTRLIKEEGLLHQVMHTNDPLPSSLQILKDRVCK